ncbi:PREDICTED: alkane hydroxylase MAH1-like [Tarenaya hassleriana]|uniref:alkane hydroxylase MAH1-like n=1 Tax=Tarenaya hassleriana TaxID=28532 RepID=UPI00053C2BE0|nr:PREDICTED: alkane hydroxylase MAH1-like [Tarenaya hassleriana]
MIRQSMKIGFRTRTTYQTERLSLLHTHTYIYIYKETRIELLIIYVSLSIRKNICLMAFLGFLEASIAFICFLIFGFLLFKKSNRDVLTNWPILGMLPSLVVQIPRVYDWSVDVLEASNLTFLFKGPWLAGMDLLVTVDPANIHHIMSSNFKNYPKGHEFKKIFDVLGDGIFNVDSDLWKDLRKSAQTMFNHQDFQTFTVRTSISKLEKGLLPLLDHVSGHDIVVDLQDVFQRFTFDTTFILMTGYDPGCLSLEMPEIEFAKALDDAEEAIFFRHIKPEFVWKLQNYVGLGVEKKMRRAQATFDRLCAKYISTKREEISLGIHSKGDAKDLLTSYMSVDTTKYELLNPGDDKFLRDTILTFMIAGRDTTGSALTWFFWLLCNNPEAVTKIRQEIRTKLPRTENRNENSLDSTDLNKLVYLHGALCEALRLYPPVPFQHKSPARPDVLPSGHRVDAGSKILFSLYALGRMRSVWGEDASEFRPERWISERGGLRHEPSFKFLSFNAGPRTCLGKEVAFMQMKTVAVKIIQNYDIKIVEGHRVDPVPSIILHMRHGFNVTVTKRCLE